MGTLVWLVAIVMAALLVIAVVRLARRQREDPPAADSRRELDRMTHDRGVSDRLLERMRRKHPDVSEQRLVRLAIAELRADRRR